MALEDGTKALPRVLGAGKISLEDLSIEELLDVRRGNQEYVAWLKSERATADKDLGEIDTMIMLRMEQTGSKKFEHAGFRGGYVTQKAGSATVLDPAGLRHRLEAMPEVPKAEIDRALPVVVVEPTVKAYLRELRKLADYSAAAAEAIAAHIQEAFSHTSLVIEEIRPILNVTDSTPRRAIDAADMAETG